MNSRIFISKNLSEVTQLNEICSASNVELEAFSFLDFEPADFEIDTDFDVIFFSSPRSVTFFLSRYSINSDKAIACIGGKTASVLQSLGKKPDFIGSASDPKEVGDELKKWLDGRIVLFPLSNISKRSVSSVIRNEQKVEVIVYQTLLKTHTIQQSDCYIFTSPSNVEAFFNSENTIDDQLAIAWGSTTSNELKKFGVEHLTLSAPSMEALISTLQENKLI